MARVQSVPYGLEGCRISENLSSNLQEFHFGRGEFFRMGRQPSGHAHTLGVIRFSHSDLCEWTRKWESWGCFYPAQSVLLAGICGTYLRAIRSLITFVTWHASNGTMVIESTEGKRKKALTGDGNGVTRYTATQYTPHCSQLVCQDSSVTMANTVSS